jgi:hypothetical protein
LPSRPAALRVERAGTLAGVVAREIVQIDLYLIPLLRTVVNRLNVQIVQFFLRNVSGTKRGNYG